MIGRETVYTVWNVVENNDGSLMRSSLIDQHQPSHQSLGSKEMRRVARLD